MAWVKSIRNEHEIYQLDVKDDNQYGTWSNFISISDIVRAIVCSETSRMRRVHVYQYDIWFNGKDCTNHLIWVKSIRTMHEVQWPDIIDDDQCGRLSKYIPIL